MGYSSAPGFGIISLIFTQLAWPIYLLVFFKATKALKLNKFYLYIPAYTAITLLLVASLYGVSKHYNYTYLFLSAYSHFAEISIFSFIALFEIKDLEIKKNYIYGLTIVFLIFLLSLFKHAAIYQTTNTIPVEGIESKKYFMCKNMCNYIVYKNVRTALIPEGINCKIGDTATLTSYTTLFNIVNSSGNITKNVLTKCQQ